MSKAKKIGIVLILIGICLPIVSLGFASNYYPRLGLIRNIQMMEIVLRPELLGNNIITDFQPIKEVPPEKKPKELKSNDWEIVKEEPIKPKIAIPYKYIFALGVVLIFAGIGIIVLSSNKKGASRI